MRVEFVDTSILVEFLDVPGKNSNRALVLEEFRRRRTAGVQFLLPTATVIETGNHVHHVKDGHARRRCAEGFAEILRLTAAGKAPWVLFEATWDSALLTAIGSGATRRWTSSSTPSSSHCPAATSASWQSGISTAAASPAMRT